MVKAKKKEAINPKGKLLGVYRNDDGKVWAISVDKKEFFMSSSDIDWKYKKIVYDMKNDIFIPPWIVDPDEWKEIKKIIEEELKIEEAKLVVKGDKFGKASNSSS